MTLDRMNVAQRAVTAVEGATSAAVLLGSQPEKRHKELALLLHPDRFGREEDWVKRAQSAKYKLDQYLAELKPDGGPKSPVRIGAWVVTAPLAKGDIADLHRVEGVDAPHAGVHAVLKIARSARDNDLIKNEREILKRIHEPKAKAEETLAHYAPVVLDEFTASGRAANVLTAADGFISLADISTMLPHLDPRHVVWMVNRGLSALGYIHRQGVIHGAITPRHLLYNPANHDMCLVDWCYAVSGVGRVKAIASEYERHYPPEVFRKQTVTAGTDLYMLAQALYGVAEKLPKGLRALLDLCLAKSPASRPDDAWKVQDRLIKAAEQEYGPRSFVKLELPKQ